MESLESAMDRVRQVVRSYRLRFGTEEHLQNDLASALVLEHVPFEREYQLGQDRIDFYLPEWRVGVECKVGGGPSAVIEQLLRYADREEIAGLILVSRRNTHAMPEDTLRGKPFSYIWVGGAGL